MAVFVDGCFWHGCPLHGTHPRTNGSYWGPKLARNVERDCDVDAVLGESGWQVVRVWEHEAPHTAADRVEGALTRRELLAAEVDASIGTRLS